MFARKKKSLMIPNDEKSQRKLESSINLEQINEQMWLSL